MRGRHSALVPVLTPQDREALEAWMRSYTLPGVLIRRARLLLAIADGATITQAAATCGISRAKTYKWLQRWHAEGLAGLQDRPRPTDLTYMNAAKARKREERMLCPMTP